jgi:hypothetical protein
MKPNYLGHVTEADLRSITWIVIHRGHEHVHGPNGPRLIRLNNFNYAHCGAEGCDYFGPKFFIYHPHGYGEPATLYCYEHLSPGGNLIHA